MLVEEGFKVVSVDASDKMLKYALRKRWDRRGEPAFNNWSESLSFRSAIPNNTAKPNPNPNPNPNPDHNHNPTNYPDIQLDSAGLSLTLCPLQIYLLTFVTLSYA